MSRHSLDYRNPREMLQRSRVLRLILQRDAVFNVKVMAMLLAGVTLSLAGPALLAGVLVSIDHEWDLRWGLSWWTLMWIAGIVSIPLLYWWEHRTRGEFYIDAARNWGLGDNVTNLGMLRTASRGEWELQTAQATWAAYLQILLFAPRLTMNALRQWRLRRNLGKLDAQRATDLVVALLATGSGVDACALLRGDETMSDLWPTLLVLILHNFIGVAKAGDRVWLLSDARRSLKEI